jgi:hypothetical protein
LRARAQIKALAINPVIYAETSSSGRTRPFVAGRS